MQTLAWGSTVRRDSKRHKETHRRMRAGEGVRGRTLKGEAIFLQRKSLSRMRLVIVVEDVVFRIADFLQSAFW